MHEKNSKERLSRRVVRGGAWVFALRILNQGFGLIRLILLARLLAPHDFGLMGIALLTMATLETFSQTGFHQALIQKNKNIEAYLDTAWTVLILRGLILFIILYFIAPYVAIFFKSPEAKPIMQVIGFSILFQAFTNIGIIYFQKELEFKEQFIYQFSGTLADFIIAVSAAFLLKNAWALVLGILAGNFVRFIVSYLVHPYRPRLSFDLGKAKELFGFGKWVLGSSVLIFLLTQGDDVFVGKLLGVTMLGFYQIAYRISNMPATEITHVISQVTFPAYSKLQHEKDKLKRALIKTLTYTTVISIPIASGIFILASEFTKVFLGEKWLPMVPAMQVMCLFGAIRSIGATFGPIYIALAKVNIPLKINFVQLIFLALIIYPLSLFWGIFGTATAITLGGIVALCLTIKKIMGILDIDFMSLFKPVFFSVLASIGMVIIILLLTTYVLKTVSFISLLSLSAIGGMCYLVFISVIYRFLGYDLKDSLRTLFVDTYN